VNFFPSANSMKRIAFFLAIVFAIAATDYMVGYKERKFIERKKALQKRIERLAWYMERTSIERVDYLSKSDLYEVKLKYTNIHPEEEMWIMVPEIRIFVQVGTLWKELPEKGADSPYTYSADRLEGRPKFVSARFKMPYRDFEELFKGYMHFKVESISDILATSVATDDIIEKDEEIFIYVSSKKRCGRLHTLLH
jgi:hypothetical protein